MKISSLKAQNIFGIRNVDVRLTEFTFFAGPNGSGKSSLENAIRLAYTGELSRVSLKKEIGQMVHEGEKQALIQIEGDPRDGTPVTITASGQSKGIPNPEDAPWWAHALTDAHYLARLEPTALRRCLFNMAGATKAEEVKRRLAEGGVADWALKSVGEIGFTRFEAVAADAEAQAKTARGAWKGVTGETYGEVKAETWTAPLPDLPETPPPDLQASFQQQADDLRTQIADKKAAAGRRERLESALRSARAASDGLADIRTAADAASADLGALRNEVRDLEAKAAGKAMPDPLATHPCPECGSVLHVMPGMEFMGKDAYDEANKSRPDPKAKMALPGKQKELKNAEAKYAAALTTIERAEKDAAKVADLEAELKELVDGGDVQKLSNSLNEVLNAQQGNQNLLAAYSEAARARRDAEQKTKAAAVAHDEVKQWSLVKTLMSPDGIPAQFLDDVLGKFNDRLRETANRTRWGQVQVHKDMRITYDGRAYGLCSESEQWRADVALTEAVSYLTAEMFLMVDRYDVLHAALRGGFLDWCDSLVREGTQVLIFGTLGAKPQPQPGITFFWLDRGIIS